MKIDKWPASVAFSAHCFLVISFVVIGGIFHEIPVAITAFIYGVALITIYALLISKNLVHNGLLGSRLAFIHLGSSLVLLVFGIVAEKVIPLVGGAISYVSAMTFYILNMPGLPFSKLLPYPGEPELLWQVLRYAVLIATTTVWLFLASVIGSLLSRVRDKSHA